MADMIPAWLKRLDCYLTDKWTGRPWMYYSAVLGAKQQMYGGSIPWSVHFGQALISRMLDFVDKYHCKKALTAKEVK
jgi:hypothetical protein